MYRTLGKLLLDFSTWKIFRKKISTRVFLKCGYAYIYQLTVDSLDGGNLLVIGVNNFYLQYDIDLQSLRNK